MPPSLMRYVDGCGASFIDLEIAPLRFGAHLSFCARSNNRRIEQVLEGWRIHDEACWNEAVVLKGYFARRGSSDIFDTRLSVGLFCGQTRVDLALVQNGAIARPEDSLEQVRDSPWRWTYWPYWRSSPIRTRKACVISSTSRRTYPTQPGPTRTSTRSFPRTT
jgi:hypothetical protein